MLSGCYMLPNDGPGFRDVNNQVKTEDPGVQNFLLVDVNGHVIETMRTRSRPSIAESFHSQAPAPNLMIGSGDRLNVSIYEAGTETLFSGSQTGSTSGGGAPPSARGVQIPEQTVSSDGKISVPFAGRIVVAGKTTEEVQQLIEKALAGKAARPQVLVSMVGNGSSKVTVVGDVVNGARVPLSSNGDRLLDVIAEAGGARSAPYETAISLTRGEATVTLPMSEVLRNPRENVFLQPGDSVVLTRQTKSFSAMGATGRTAQILFDSSGVNLIEAVAKAGGLTDGRADPRGVYLFRLEAQDVAKNLGLGDQVVTPGSLIPVIYRLDLTQAGGYFVGQGFEMRDRDIIYVASAPTNEVMKFLQLIGAAAQPVIQGVVIDRATQ